MRHLGRLRVNGVAVEVPHHRPQLFAFIDGVEAAAIRPQPVRIEPDPPIQLRLSLEQLCQHARILLSDPNANPYARPQRGILNPRRGFYRPRGPGCT